jgi:hypothetical protein
MTSIFTAVRTSGPKKINIHINKLAKYKQYPERRTQDSCPHNVSRWKWGLKFVNSEV